jgi:hypothetical protein
MKHVREAYNDDLDAAIRQQEMDTTDQRIKLLSQTLTKLTTALNKDRNCVRNILLSHSVSICHLFNFVICSNMPNHPSHDLYNIVVRSDPPPHR